MIEPVIQWGISLEHIQDPRETQRIADQFKAFQDSTAGALLMGTLQIKGEETLRSLRQVGRGRTEPDGHVGECQGRLDILELLMSPHFGLGQLIEERHAELVKAMKEG